MISHPAEFKPRTCIVMLVLQISLVWLGDIDQKFKMIISVGVVGLIWLQ
jgi:hypothetical protein